MQPTERFTGLAKNYAQARPSYPDAAIDFIIKHCGLSGTSVVADVGAGTGISSRLFADRGMSVIGIEPNDDMRAQANQEALDKPCKGALNFQHGTAEATELKSSSVDAVLAAQAFHWFRVEPTLEEFRRILKPNGWVVLIWNERDEKNAITKGYGDALRQLPETKDVEMKRGIAGEPLLASDLFVSKEKQFFENSQILDKAGFISRAFSASYVPQSGAAAEALKRQLEELFDQCSHDGIVEMQYATSVYVGRKP